VLCTMSTVAECTSMWWW